MHRLPFFSFVNQEVFGNLLLVNSGSSPWFKPIRVGTEGPNISRSSIPTLLRLPLAMASARLTEQPLERQRYRSCGVGLTCDRALPDSSFPARDDDGLFYIWERTFLWRPATSGYLRRLRTRTG